MQRAACTVLERTPLMAVMDDLRSEKQRWQRSQAMTLLYGWSLLLAIWEASLL